MKHIALTAIAAVSLTACTRGPDAIPTIDLGPAYSGVSCAEAHSMLAEATATCKAAEDNQRGAVMADTAFSVLVGIPVARTIAPDTEIELAVAKSKEAALTARVGECE